MSDGPREIGRMQVAQGGRRETLAVSVDGPDVLIGPRNGQPWRLGAAERDLFMVLFMDAERQAGALTPEEAPDE